MEENNNQQQYQQYQAPQQPQGAPQGNQMFQGFKAPNTEEGLKKAINSLVKPYVYNFRNLSSNRSCN